MFSVLSAVLEPFLLIALGYALRGTKRFGAKELWDGVEKLVFWVLFPPLLFNSVAHAKLTGLDTAEFLLFGTLAMATGVFMAKAVSKMAPADPMTDASVRQTGYRFNSYICFALALNMYGQEALALVALLTGIWVPISNAIAVADLSYAAKTGGKTSIGSIVKSIFTNPLIVSTLAGLFANILTHLTGFQVPNFLTKIFSSLGSASMATALLAIGAGLAVEDFARYKKLIALSTIQRLIVLPAVALAVAGPCRHTDGRIDVLRRGADSQFLLHHGSAYGWQRPCRKRSYERRSAREPCYHSIMVHGLASICFLGKIFLQTSVVRYASSAGSTARSPSRFRDIFTSSKGIRDTA